MKWAYLKYLIDCLPEAAASGRRTGSLLIPLPRRLINIKLLSIAKISRLAIKGGLK